MSQRPPLQRLAMWVDRGLETLLIGIFTLMTVSVLWQVFTRYLLGAPSSITEELARYLLVWLGLLGGAHAFRHGLHLAIQGPQQAIVRRLGARAGRWTTGLTLLLVATFAAATLVVGGGNLVRLTLALEQRSAALRIPLGWVYTVLPLAGVLILFHCLVFALGPPVDDTETPSP